MLDERCRRLSIPDQTTSRSVHCAALFAACGRGGHPARRTAFLNGRRADLYEFALFLVLLYEAPLRPSTRARRWVDGVERFTCDVDGTDRHAYWKRNWTEPSRRCITRRRHSKSQLAEMEPTRQGRTAFRFLRRFVNYDPRPGGDASDTGYPVDYFIGRFSVECHRDHLVIGRRRVKVLSMKEPPAQTFAPFLASLYAIPGDLIACLEWQRHSAPTGCAGTCSRDGGTSSTSVCRWSTTYHSRSQSLAAAVARRLRAGREAQRPGSARPRP